MSAEADSDGAGWGALFRGEHGLYTALVIIAVACHALQILVIAIIMPTVVADLGGADYYTWPAMVYTIGAIVGSAGVGPVWAKLGRRGGLILGGFIFIVGSVGCALAPDMATLNIARTIQGFAGGLINGGAMEMVSGLFTPARRKRVLALTQGVWMTAQLSGPIVGGAFAEIGWWRGSFWVMLPIVAPLMILAWYRIPAAHGRAAEGRGSQRLPFMRLGMLTAGVFCIGLAGPLHHTGLRILLITGAVFLVGLTLRFDRAADNRLYPSGTLSITSQVGPALWIFFLVGMVQTTVMLFVPLLLQVVHGVTPLFISFVSIVISFGWTAATFMVSGHSERREDRALAAGPVLMVFGLGGMTLATAYPALWPLTGAALILGAGVGLHHVLLVARTMGQAVAGEERITAAALPSVRAIGTAFGAALGGMLSIMAGLGDATDPAAVGPAIVFVYGVNLVPVLAAAGLMIWLVRPAKR
ncbi:MAG: MFS transporter [Alphaproteobacteria bacterium]|nr:MFS transporter [Alphaproteobacteria bacterium]